MARNRQDFYNIFGRYYNIWIFSEFFFGIACFNVIIDYDRLCTYKTYDLYFMIDEIKYFLKSWLVPVCQNHGFVFHLTAIPSGIKKLFTPLKVVGGWLVRPKFPLLSFDQSASSPQKNSSIIFLKISFFWNLQERLKKSHYV